MVPLLPADVVIAPVRMNAYEQLGVEAGAEEAAIRRAYRYVFRAFFLAGCVERLWAASERAGRLVASSERD